MCDAVTSPSSCRARPEKVDCVRYFPNNLDGSLALSENILFLRVMMVGWLVITINKQGNQWV